MTKNHGKMRRKSRHAQDAQLNQNLAGMADELGDQPTRPTVHPQQAIKSASEQPRNTK